MTGTPNKQAWIAPFRLDWLHVLALGERVRPFVAGAPIVAFFLAMHAAAGTPPTVAGISTSLGPKGQWISIRGSNFTRDIEVFLGDIPVPHVCVYHDKELGVSCPTDVPGAYLVKVKNAEGEGKAPVLYTVGVPTGPPEVIDVRVCPNHWVYLAGKNFVWGQTTVTFKDTRAQVYVYSPTSAGVTMPPEFTRSSTFVLTTPNGEVMSYGK